MKGVHKKPTGSINDADAQTCQLLIQSKFETSLLTFYFCTVQLDGENSFQEDQLRVKAGFLGAFVEFYQLYSKVIGIITICLR